MSHFVVLVIGDDVDGQLAPFNEDMETMFCEFQDCTEEVAEEFKKPERREEYGSVDALANDYFGYSRQSTLEGVKYGYYHNPRAKWDWYVIGGRWTGYFKAKDGARALLGESGVFGNAPKPGYTDQLRIKDIDFDGMFEDAMREANERYNEFEKATKGLPMMENWKSVLERFGEDKIEEARTFYHDQEMVKALQEANLMPFMACPTEVYRIGTGGRDAYVENSKCSSLIPFAILMDGEWYEKGDMGWWGMVANEKSQYDWSAKFAEIWETLDPDTLVTAVDCHI